MSSRSDYLPTATLDVLQLRAHLLATVRRFFDARGYLEVDTPLLSHERVVDPHLEPFVVEGSSGPLYLQTSPEFAMKRLLAAGAGAIYQVGHVFRRRTGAAPQPRIHDGRMVSHRRFAPGTDAGRRGPRRRGLPRRRKRGHSVFSPGSRVPFARTTYRDAFRRLAGKDVVPLSATQLATLARERGISIPASLDPGDRDGWLNLLLTELVEPHLGRERPEFVHDYPATQAALAVIRSEDQPVAERFELYIAGVELCNGYHELTDPAELRRRIAIESQRRAAEGQPPLPEPQRLLAAMEAGLPPCAGVALGFDRLLMLVAGKSSVVEVLPFGFERC